MTTLRASEQAAAQTSPSAPGHLQSLCDRLNVLVDNRIRYYRAGRVEERTFPELLGDVLRASDVLASWGVGKLSRIGICSPNCYEWVVCDLALNALNAVVVALPVEPFAESAPEQLAEHYGLELLITTELQAVRADRPWVVPISLQASARTRRPSGDWGSDPDLFSLVFSSGTSGRLKCLRVSRRGTDELLASFGRARHFEKDDAILAFLPLASFQQRWMLYAAIVYGFDLLLCEAPQLFRALGTLRPTILAAPPLLYETIEARYWTLPPVRRMVLDIVRWLLCRAPSGIRRKLGSILFAPIHRGLGGRMRFLLSGAAPSRLSTLQFFSSIGLDLYQAYGLTETGFLSWNLPTCNRPGSVGLPVYPGSLTLADDGEIIFHHRYLLTSGYLGGDSEDAEKTFIGTNRIATGDVGRFDAQGYLYIVGRKKQIIVTQGGVKIHPEELESAIERNPHVARAVVFGGGDLRFLTAIVSLRGSDQPAIRQSIGETIDQLNARTAESSRVLSVVFTNEQFTRENGLLNRALKVDRARALERFAPEISATHMRASHAWNAA